MARLEPASEEQMRTRPAVREDYARLREIHERSGLKFPLPDLDSPMTEAVEVVVDEQGEIMLAAIAVRTAEIVLLAPKGQLHPVVKMEGIRLLHSAIRDTICPKGYAEGFAFCPPQIAKSFGRHLKKWFGWQTCWSAYRILDWKGEPDA
jgi:hypothetical protein